MQCSATEGREGPELWECNATTDSETRKRHQALCLTAASRSHHDCSAQADHPPQSQRSMGCPHRTCTYTLHPVFQHSPPPPQAPCRTPPRAPTCSSRASLPMSGTAGSRLPSCPISRVRTKLSCGSRAAPRQACDAPACCLLFLPPLAPVARPSCPQATPSCGSWHTHTQARAHLAEHALIVLGHQLQLTLRLPVAPSRQRARWWAAAPSPGVRHPAGKRRAGGQAGPGSQPKAAGARRPHCGTGCRVPRGPHPT